MDDTTRFTTIASPLGTLLLTANDAALTGLYLAEHRKAPAVAADWVEDPDALSGAATQLREYFEGARQRFTLRLRPRGTEFQRRVWDALLAIDHGNTESYGRLAARIGQPKAARAVGLANGRNPISIVIPCHRVVGADGSLTGYGWGEQRKAWLLAHEAGSARLVAES